jgi:hypothetical protein
MKHSMTRMSQKPPLDADLDKDAAESPSPIGPLHEEQRPDHSKAARLRAIQELVRSDKYHVPASLVAEQMIQRAGIEDQDQED